MANLILMIAFGVLVCDHISLVTCADKCKTHADCGSSIIKFYCCGGYLRLDAKAKERSCRIGSCLHRYCANDSDCGDRSMCCRSNRCVNKGCYGCTKNSDCYTTYVCCKKTLPLDQTVCAENCINQTCNSNDDCSGWSECCRSGKCTRRGCSEKCALNSECNSDQYCCKKAKRPTGPSYLRKPTNCAKTCIGELCRTNEDCGARNECCISDKCVDRGCSGCSTNSNCSAGHYCCKRQWYGGEFSECSAGGCTGKFCSTIDDCGGPGETCDSNSRCAVLHQGCTKNWDCGTGKYCCKKRKMYSGAKLSECSETCIGKSCNRSDDCGGPGEICDWNRKCTLRHRGIKQSTENSSTNSSNSFPPWLIAVLTISLVVFFSAVGMVFGVLWYVRRMRSANASQSRDTVFFQNRRFRGAETPSQQQNIQFSDSSNPTTSTDQLQHGDYENVPNKSHKPIHEPQEFRNMTAKGNLNSAHTSYDDERYQLETERQNNDFHHYHTIQQEPFYDTVEPTDTS